MKYYFVLFLILIASKVFAQSTEEKYVLPDGNNNFSPYPDIDSLSETEYLDLRKLYFKKEVEPETLNSDSLERETQRKFPSVFTLKDSCYTFKDYAGNYFKICDHAYQNEKDFYSASHYKFLSSTCNFIQMSVEVYESKGFYSINPLNGESLSTIGRPVFINCEYAYSYQFDYGDAGISIRRIKDKKELDLWYRGFNVEESFYFPANFVFKLKPIPPDSTYLFIKVHIR